MGPILIYFPVKWVKWHRSSYKTGWATLYPTIRIKMAEMRNTQVVLRDSVSGYLLLPKRIRHEHCWEHYNSQDSRRFWGCAAQESLLVWWPPSCDSSWTTWKAPRAYTPATVSHPLPLSQKSFPFSFIIINVSAKQRGQIFLWHWGASLIFCSFRNMWKPKINYCFSTFLRK